MKASNILALLVILCLVICTESRSYEEEASAYSSRTISKRQASIDPWISCEKHLQQCQNFLNVPPTNDSAANLKIGCHASVESFRCLEDALTKCPLSTSSQTHMRTILLQIITGFSNHCNNTRVHTDYAVPDNLACLEKTKLSTGLCTSLYLEKLFAMTGHESELQFCCARLEFLKCIAIDADEKGCVETARKVLGSHATAMFLEVVRSRSTDSCTKVKFAMCRAEPAPNRYTRTS